MKATHQGRLATVALDGDGRIRHGSVTVSCAGGRVLIRMPFRTFSPSAGSGSAWGGHWRTNAAIKAAWRARLEAAVNASAPPAVRTAAAAGVALFESPASRIGWHRPAGLAQLVCRRVVTSRAHLIRDDDNLRFSFKGLIDMIVAAGFLRGDSFDEVERVCQQELAVPGGLEWTEIEIDARDRSRWGVVNK